MCLPLAACSITVWAGEERGASNTVHVWNHKSRLCKYQGFPVYFWTASWKRLKGLFVCFGTSSLPSLSFLSQWWVLSGKDYLTINSTCIWNCNGAFHPIWLYLRMGSAIAAVQNQWARIGAETLTIALHQDVLIQWPPPQPHQPQEVVSCFNVTGHSGCTRVYRCLKDLLKGLRPEKKYCLQVEKRSSIQKIVNMTKRSKT